MYHWEADQEDFLVLSGEALLIVEGEERPLKAWDFVHFPPKAEHTIVGAGDGPVRDRRGRRAGRLDRAELGRATRSTRRRRGTTSDVERGDDRARSEAYCADSGGQSARRCATTTAGLP